MAALRSRIRLQEERSALGNEVDGFHPKMDAVLRG
jgi:hypothetical protein